jgi:ribA/ribD-fused uncharacterized protein
MPYRRVEEVIQACQLGVSLDFLFFWGHRPGRGITASCFSQWYPAPFQQGGHQYATAEHYMMAEKARLFDDHQRLDEILACSDPDRAKALGRKVRGFDPTRWQAAAYDIVVAGNLAKFSQNPLLKQFLLSTHSKVLVEVSPVDAIWGIGLHRDDPRVSQPEQWQGSNLLGFALMEVRQRLGQT